MLYATSKQIPPSEIRHRTEPLSSGSAEGSCLGPAEKGCFEEHRIQICLRKFDKRETNIFEYRSLFTATTDRIRFHHHLSNFPQLSKKKVSGRCRKDRFEISSRHELVEMYVVPFHSQVRERGTDQLKLNSS